MDCILRYYVVIFGGLLVLRLVYPPFMIRWLFCWSMTLAVQVLAWALAQALSPFFGRLAGQWVADVEAARRQEMF